MSAQIPPPGPGGPDDLERALAAALRAEADAVVPAGDGLARIRARTEGKAGAFAWLRPQVLLGGAAALAVIALGVVATSQLGGGHGGTNVVERAPEPIVGASTPPPFATESLNTRMSPDPTPETPIGPEGGEDPTPNAEITAPKVALPQPVTEDQERNRTDGGIPVDDGGTYVAIQSPFSGTTIRPVFTIAGLARVFEAAVTIDISQNGTVLKQTHAMASQGAPELGDWQVTVELAPGNYRIDAYALSPQDGTTRLATDSIWITVSRPVGATPTPAPTATASPSATAPASRAPSTTPTSGAQVPAAESQD